MNDRMREALEKCLDFIEELTIQSCRRTKKYRQVKALFQYCNEVLEENAKAAPSDDEVERVARAIWEAVPDGITPEDSRAVAVDAIAAMDARAEVGEVDLEAGVEAMWDEYRKSSNTPEFMKDVTWSEAVEYASKSDHWRELVRTGREQVAVVAKLWNLKIKEQKPCSENT